MEKRTEVFSMFTKGKFDFFFPSANVVQELLASLRNRLTHTHRQTNRQQGYISADKNVNRQCSPTRVHIRLCFIDLPSVKKPFKAAF